MNAPRIPAILFPCVAGPEEHWRPTMDLRLVVRATNQLYPPMTLQQRWVNDDASRSDWRDVPQVTEQGRPVTITR